MPSANGEQVDGKNGNLLLSSTVPSHEVDVCSWCTRNRQRVEGNTIQSQTVAGIDEALGGNNACVRSPRSSFAVIGNKRAIHSKPHHEFEREPPHVLCGGGLVVLPHEMPPGLIPLTSASNGSSSSRTPGIEVAQATSSTQRSPSPLLEVNKRIRSMLSPPPHPEMPGSGKSRTVPRASSSRVG